MKAVEGVEEKVIMHFSKVAKIPQSEVDLNADIIDRYAIDSVKTLKLISEIEVDYDIDIADCEAKKIRTLNDVIALIKAKA
jgi:acyl carrier protein